MDRDGGRAATYRDAFAVGEFRAIWTASIASLLGDQLARIALSVLVFHRTGSPLLTATVYAVGYLPWVVGGPILAGLADRYPRRTVMVICDVGRAALVAVMVIPHVPFLGLCALLFCTELLSPPFTAARSATLPDMLPGDVYVLGSAVTNVTNELGQFVGFAAGGGVVAVLGTRGALAADAATFLLSAVLVRFGVRPRRLALDEQAEPASLLSGAVGAARMVFRQPALRALVCLAWLCAFYIVPEGLAVPYAAVLHGGAAAVGLLLAANPAGTVLGALIISRFVSPVRRLRLMGPLAILSCLPLLGFLARPNLAWATGLLVLSGFGSAYNLPANAAFVSAVPGNWRGRAFGLVQSGMFVFQGLALFTGGLVAEWFGPSRTIAGAGAIGAAVALLLALGALRPQHLSSHLTAAKAAEARD